MRDSNSDFVPTTVSAPVPLSAPPLAPSRRAVIARLCGVAMIAAFFAPRLGVAQTPPPENAGAPAMDALKRALQTLEEARADRFEGHLDKSMVGYSVLVQYAMDLSTKFKDVRFLLKEPQILAAKDATVITVPWERRALQLPKLTPELRTGRASILLHRVGNDWLLAGVAGDNLFKP